MKMFMIICSFLVVLAVSQTCAISTVPGGGGQIVVCKHVPIDLGIVLDSSSSISRRDFDHGKTFLQHFLELYEIGDSPEDVRAAIITFGRGIYPQDAFNLTTYHSKDEVIAAIGKIPHRAGPYTATGDGINYMSQTQLSASVTRPGADRIGIVLTDGNSQEGSKTAEAAKIARDSGIIMFAVGVGVVRDSELLNIAGDADRVIKVKSYADLEDIKQKLARKTCVSKPKPTTTPLPTTVKPKPTTTPLPTTAKPKPTTAPLPTTAKPKPTTTPLPQTACGVDSPADIYFAFSPQELGMAGTAWTTSFISSTVGHAEMENGFRFGVVSGNCPDDEGFDLDDYTTAKAIQERVSLYRKSKMSQLVEKLEGGGYSAASGGRPDARDIAVLVAGRGKRAAITLKKQVARLRAMGVKVFIADPTNSGITIDGAITLQGRDARAASIDFVAYMCTPGKSPTCSG